MASPSSHTRRLLLSILMAVAALAVTPKTQAISLKSFALDSIAAWGKFPRFCVNTYRWGDHFFNPYDSTYVVGSGKRWNVKTKFDSFLDFYDFHFDNRYRLEMASDASTSAGLYVTYMAVSLGYDINVNKLLGIRSKARKKFNVQFNCALFTVEYYTISNDVGTYIYRMGYPDAMRKVDIDFKGINTSSWGVDLYYFFNHKHYSQAAVFNYSKIQIKSSGSLFVGLSFWGQRYRFDFESVRQELGDGLPPDWDYRYDVKNKNYCVKFGYGYNWALGRWCIGVSEAPIMGIRTGYINDPNDHRTTFSLMNRLRAGVVWNYKKRWFIGLMGAWDAQLIYDRAHTLLSSNLSVEASAGYRFDLWK